MTQNKTACAISVYAKNGWYPQSTNNGRQAWMRATTNWTWKLLWRRCNNGREERKIWREMRRKFLIWMAEKKSRHCTYHLNDGKCFFPPQIFTKLRSQSGQTVVGVHDHVDTAINEGKKGIVSTSAELESNPDAPRNKWMMNDVKCWDVSKLFPQDKEYLLRYKC